MTARDRGSVGESRTVHVWWHGVAWAQTRHSGGSAEGRVLQLAHAGHQGIMRT